MVGTSKRNPRELGAEAMRRVERHVDTRTGPLGESAAGFLQRHRYRITDDGGGPHHNVLGHPLFELPVWLADAATVQVDTDTLLDVCESSLCGYLSVRAEDDFFDGDWDDPGAVMMVSSFFRTRHHALLAPLVPDPRFWERSATVWSAYADAMLVERSLHHPEATYGPEQFELVLDRSQPLEIPGDAVLVVSGRWDDSESFAAMVRHLTRATQLLDDFVDAVDDRAAGNYTWMVRRLGGLDGESALRRGMISSWDRIQEEAGLALTQARSLAESLGIGAMETWIDERARVVARSTERMYRTLFEAIGTE